MSGLHYLLLTIGVKKEDIEKEIDELLFPVMHDGNAIETIVQLLIDWWIYTSSGAGSTIVRPASFILHRVKALRKPQLNRVTAEEGQRLASLLLVNFIRALPQEEIESLEQETRVFRQS